ncbi:MAG: PucR family transcriptional regulator [Propioniciclava sp.]
MHGLSVREALRIPALRGSRLVAGAAGLGRQVTAANIMEVPDIEAFIHPGDLLLTTAYPLRDREGGLVSLVEELVAHQVAGLAIKLNRYIESLPAAALAVAERAAFPVVVIPDSVVFGDVLTAVFALLLDETPDVAEGDSVAETLTRIAFTGGGLQEIAGALALALDRVVRLSAAGVTCVALRDGRAGDWPAGLPVQQVALPGDREGMLEVGGVDPLTLEEHRVVRQAGFAAGLYAAQLHATAELDELMRLTYLEELVAGPPINKMLVGQRSQHYGWRLEDLRTVALAALPEGLDAALALAKTRADTDLHDPLVWSRGRELVAFVRPGAQRLSAWAHRWHQVLGEMGDAVVVAVGSEVAGVDDLPRAHAQARAVLELGSRTGRSVATHGDLGLERILLAADPDLADDFIATQLGPLLTHDERHQGQLAETVAHFLGQGNAALTARELGVHYNTVKHRLARVQELLGCDLTDPAVRLGLGVALMALSVRR